MMVSEKQTASREWLLLGQAWGLVAASFRYPDMPLSAAVASGRWARSACETLSASEVPLPDRFPVYRGPVIEAGEEGGVQDADTVLADALRGLRVEATRLFVGAPEPVVSPYEGVWRAREEGTEELLFANPYSVAVERFCRVCGLGHPAGTNEPLDHIATECELLAFLAAHAALGTGEAPASVAEEVTRRYGTVRKGADWPGGSAAAAYGMFLREHMARWAAPFAESIRREARHPFFLDAALLLDAMTVSSSPDSR